MPPERVGRYEIKAELGRGGMATVFVAHDPRFKRAVAVKLLPAEFLHDPAFRARFTREAEVIASLEHPAIVPVYDYGDEGGQPYIVMRLMAGGTLADRLRAGPLSLEQVARLTSVLASALDRAHAKGIIHRDLKPSNILFDEDGHAYLSDFGIAKFSAANTAMTGTSIIGTPAYMSPEQARGDRDIDGRSDIYALGALLFELLTGRQPYDAETPMGMAVQHITAPVPDIRAVRPSLPAETTPVIEKAMAKTREARYASAGELAAAVGRLPTAVPAEAKPAARQPPGPAALAAHTQKTEYVGVEAAPPSSPPPRHPAPPSPPAASSLPVRPAKGRRLAGAGIAAGGLVALAVCLGLAALSANYVRGLFGTPAITAAPTLTAALSTRPPTSAAETAAAAPTLAPNQGPLGPTPFACADELGCLTLAPGEAIRLAWALVMSGPNAALGIDAQRAIEMAVGDRDFVLLGRPVELIGEDTLCTAEGGQAAAEKLAAEQGLVAVIGTSCSSEARLAAPILSDAGLVMVSPSNTAPELTDPANHVPGYLRTADNDRIQGALAAEFAVEQLKAATAATIHDGSSYSAALAALFAERFAELGGEVVATETIRPDGTGMPFALRIAAAAQPDLLYFPLLPEPGIRLVVQAHDLNVRVPWRLSADGLFSSELPRQAGTAAQDIFLTSPDVARFGPDYGRFLDRFRAVYGEAPSGLYAAHAYDAAGLIFAAIERVAVAEPDGTLHIGRQALRAAVFATRDLQGLTGRLTCTPSGDCGAGNISVYHLHDIDPGAWDPGVNPERVYP